MGGNKISDQGKCKRENTISGQEKGKRNKKNVS